MTTTLAKKVDMFVLYIADYTGSKLEETLFVHPTDVPKLKKQLQTNVFIDLGDRMIPRKRVLDLKVESEDESLVTFLASLEPSARKEANHILVDRRAKHLKTNGAKHLKQILTDRWIIS